MLSRVTGVLEHLDGGRATVGLTAAGVALDVLLPAFLAVRLVENVGRSVTLHTKLEFDPQGTSGALTPRLIGFDSEAHRRFFEKFTTVKGVGGKRALRAMVEPPERIALSINERDTVALQRLPEIGKRLAETIVAELHGKLDEFVPEMIAPDSTLRADEDVKHQAIQALVRLGDAPAQAEVKVLRALERDSGLETAESLLAAALSGAAS